MSGHKVTDPEVLRRIAALIVLEHKRQEAQRERP